MKSKGAWLMLIVPCMVVGLLASAFFPGELAAQDPDVALAEPTKGPILQPMPPLLAEDIMPFRPGRMIESLSSSDHVVVPIYFVPKNISPDTRYLALVNQRMQWAQAWYGWQMRDRTFTLAPAVTVIGNHDLDWYYESEDPSNWGYAVWDHVFSDLANLGYPSTSNRVWGVFFHHSGQGAPALGGGWASGGGQFLVAIDSLVNDCRGVGCTASIADGGLAHELGHAFGLPHPQDEADVGHSVMSWGLYSFPETSLLNSSLNPERDTLHNNPMFNQSLNLLNPSFEDCLDHWTVSQYTLPGCSETRHSGISALQLAPTASGGYQVWQDTTVSGSTTYDFGIWVKLGGGVTLYSGVNYSGVAETFLGDDSCLPDNPIGNDTASSIHVLSGHEATLYEHCDYGGQSETFTTDDPDLSDNPIGTDVVSSVKVGCTSHSLPAGMAFDILLEIYDSSGRLLATETIDMSDVYCRRDWVHLGRVIAMPLQASRTRVVVDAQSISDSAVVLVDDLQFQPSPGVPPVPSAIFQSTQMPFNITRPTLSWDDTAWATVYQIQVAGNSQFRLPVVDSATQWPWYEVPIDLQWNIPYHWRIRVQNGAGFSPWLDAGQFIVQSGSAYQSDEFDSRDLDPAWSWIREDPTHWGWDGPSYKDHQGALKIRLQSGSLDGPTNNARNVLLRQVTGNHVFVSTRLRFNWGSPNNNSEQAGLVFYQDDDNFVKLVRGYMDGYVLGLGFEQDGQASWYPMTIRENTLHLKLERDGDIYRGSFSPDGFLWYPVGPSVTADWSNPRVGLVAYSGESTSQYDADFDWWHVVDLDMMPEFRSRIYAPLVVRQFVAGDTTPPITPKPGVSPNLVQNPGYEDGQQAPYQVPPYWTTDAWQDVSAFVWDNAQAHSGHNSIRIDSPVTNDARWIQTVEVSPNTEYVLSGWIKTDGVVHAEGSGANLGLYGTWEHTPGLFGTNDWTFVSMEFNSGSSTEVTVACRLGYWAGTSTGSMWCDDIRLSPLIANPGFEQGTTWPDWWATESWGGSAIFVWDSDNAHWGSRSARISSDLADDARWKQTVPVLPDTDYVLSGWIKTEDVAHSSPVDAGANLSVDGTWVRTNGVLGTNDWTYVSLTFNSGNSTEVTIDCRLGFWAGTTTGTAWFDDISLQPLSRIRNRE